MTNRLIDSTNNDSPISLSEFLFDNDAIVDSLFHVGMMAPSSSDYSSEFGEFIEENDCFYSFEKLKETTGLVETPEMTLWASNEYDWDSNSAGEKIELLQNLKLTGFFAEVFVAIRTFHEHGVLVNNAMYRIHTVYGNTMEELDSAIRSKVTESIQNMRQKQEIAEAATEKLNKWRQNQLAKLD